MGGAIAAILRVAGNCISWRPVDADDPCSSESSSQSSNFGERVTFEIRTPTVEITTHYPDDVPAMGITIIKPQPSYLLTKDNNYHLILPRS